MLSKKYFGLTLVASLLIMHYMPIDAGEVMWTFDQDASQWEAANGMWEVRDGVYYQNQRWGEAIHSLVGSTTWSDYTLDGKVRIHEGNWGGIVFRAQDEFQYYVYLVCPKEKKSELWIHKTGGPLSRQAIDEEIEAVNVELKRNVWLNFQVQVKGSRIKLSINGELQAEFIDDTYKQGKVGVWAWDTLASFDDVRISGERIGVLTSVRPRQHLSLTWSRLKLP